MKPPYSIAPTLLKLGAAMVLAGASLAASAGVPDYQNVQSATVDQTDRLIVKYRDAVAAGKAGARVRRARSCGWRP